MGILIKKKDRQGKTEHKESEEIQQNLINTLHFKITYQFTLCEKHITLHTVFYSVDKSALSNNGCFHCSAKSIIFKSCH